MKNLFKGAATFLAVLFLFSAFSQTPKVSAESIKEAEVVLHKLLFENGKLPSESPNDGKNNPFEGPELQNFEGLNDVTFAIYDVSDAYGNLKAKGKNEKEILQLLRTKENGQKVKEVTTTTEKGEKGIARFFLPETDAKGQKKVYRIEEIAAPKDQVKELGAPIILTLPYVDENGHHLSTIHLYPKNEGTEHPKTPDIEKEIENKKSSYQLGDTVSFKITTTIPEDIAELTRYEVKDKADKNLWLKEGTIKATVNGQSVMNLGKVVKENHDFRLVFQPKELSNLAGQVMEITYDMTVKGLLPLEKIANVVTVYPGDYEPITDKETITTGGKKFLKVDLDDHNIHLAGAKFVIKNHKGQYLFQQDGVNYWVDKEEDEPFEEALYTVLTSDSDGAFAISGLEFGKYELLEIKGPKGYNRNKKSIPFTIDETTYPSETSNTLTVVNERRPGGHIPGTGGNPPGETPPKTPNTPETPGTPKTPRVPFPQTGEVVKKVGPAVGIVLIIVGTVIFVVKKKNNQKGER